MPSCWHHALFKVVYQYRLHPQPHHVSFDPVALRSCSCHHPQLSQEPWADWGDCSVNDLSQQTYTVCVYTERRQHDKESSWHCQVSLFACLTHSSLYLLISTAMDSLEGSKWNWWLQSLLTIERIPYRISTHILLVSLVIECNFRPVG